MVHPEEALVDVEEWTTLNWRQLEPEQKDRLLNGLLEGAQIPDFPPGEFTVTGPLQPRFQVYEKAIYIGSPLQIAGRFKSTTTGPRGLEAPELESYLAKIKTADGRLTNLDAIVAAHYGSSITVRQAREESVLLAEETAMNPGPALPSQTTLYGDFVNDPNRRLVVTDLHESAVGTAAPPRSNHLIPAGVAALFLGVILGVSDYDARSRFQSALGLAPEMGTAQNSSVRANSKKSKLPPTSPSPEPSLTPVPTLSSGIRVSASELEKSSVKPGANRWAVSIDEAVVVLRPPALKPDLVVPSVAPQESGQPEIIANRWLGTYGMRDENGVTAYSVWDLEKSRVITRLLEKNLTRATLLGPQAEAVVTFADVPGIGLNLKWIETASGKVLHEQVLKDQSFQKVILSTSKDRFVFVTRDANQNPLAYHSTWKASQAQEKPVVQPVSIGLLKGADQKILFSNDDKWLAVSRNESVIVSSTNDWKMKFNFQIPGSNAQTHLVPIAFSNDDRLILLQDSQRIFVYSSLSIKPALSQLAPLGVGNEFLSISRDGLRALLRNTAKNRLIERPLIEPNKQKEICKSDCYKSLALAPVETNSDFSWLHVPVRTQEKENSFWDLESGQGFVPEYDLKKALAFWDEVPPSKSAAECISFPKGCLQAAKKTFEAKDFARAYAYYYGSCRAGIFDACVEIVKSAAPFNLNPKQALSFVEFSCRYGHASSCAARTPAAAPPAPTTEAPHP